MGDHEHRELLEASPLRHLHCYRLHECHAGAGKPCQFRRAKSNDAPYWRCRRCVGSSNVKVNEGYVVSKDVTLRLARGNNKRSEDDSTVCIVSSWQMS